MSTETSVSMTEVQDTQPLMYEYQPSNNTFLVTYEDGTTVETSTPDLSEEVIAQYKYMVRGNTNDRANAST